MHCADSRPDECDFSHETAWMSDLSGFKKLSRVGGHLTCLSQMKDNGEKKKVSDRQMNA